MAGTVLDVAPAPPARRFRAHLAMHSAGKAAPTPTSRPPYLQRISKNASTCSSAFSGLGMTL